MRYEISCSSAEKVLTKVTKQLVKKSVSRTFPREHIFRAEISRVKSLATVFVFVTFSTLIGN